MRRLWPAVSALLVGSVLGLASAWWAIRGGAGESVHNGVWSYNPLVGSSAAGIYTRARAVVAGPLALNQSEAIYLIATTDETGAPLRSDRNYRVEGRSLDARWWSITAYDADGFLIGNTQNRYSYNSGNVRRERSGAFSIRLSRLPSGGNWIPTGGAGSFFLALRLYNPAPPLRAQLDSTVLPRVVAEGGGR